jgi:dipeptidyl aminopeptidase/acylaminoacyl peptidase
MKDLKAFPLVLICYIWWHLAMSSCLWTQQSIPLSIEDALNTRSFGAASPFPFSPDGEWIAYMARQNSSLQLERDSDVYLSTGGYDEDQHSDIWVLNVATGVAKNLTRGKGANWDPVWSPDGHYVAFLSASDGGGQAQLFIWDLRRDAVRPVCSAAIRALYRINEIRWTPDSGGIIIPAIPQDQPLEQYIGRVLAPTATQERQLPPTPGSTVSLFESHNHEPASATTSVPNLYNLDALFLHDLILVDILRGETRTIVRGRLIADYALSHDGLYVAYSVPKRFYEGGGSAVSDLIVVSLATGGETIVASNVLLRLFSWSPDSASIAYVVDEPDSAGYEFDVVHTSDAAKHTIAVLPRPTLRVNLGLIPLWDSSAECFYFIFDGSLWRARVRQQQASQISSVQGHTIECVVAREDGLLWTSDQGQAALVLVHDDEHKQDGFYKIDLASGRSTKLLERGQCYICKWPHANSFYLTAASSSGSRVAYIAEDAKHAPDLWLAEGNFTKVQQLTHLNPQLDKYKMGSPRLVSWLGADGERLDGALLLPSTYEVGHKYPMIVYVYRAAHLSNHLNQFAVGEYPGPLNLQLLATRGYAVLLPDTDERENEPMASLARSVLPGINKVIELGIADPERIGVMGHSGGGYSTLALIVQTTRFKAAVECSGWGDYFGYYGELTGSVDYPYAQSEGQLGGTLWSYPLRYFQNSPLFALDRVETPLLIVQGSQDNQVSSFLADEMFMDLQRLGKSVRYAKYAGEGHVPGYWSYANQLDLAGRVIAWFDSHLK